MQLTLDGQQKNYRIIVKNYEATRTSVPKSMQDLFNIKLLPKSWTEESHDYQITAINNFMQRFKSTHRSQLILTLGTRKIFTNVWIKVVIRPKRTL